MEDDQAVWARPKLDGFTSLCSTRPSCTPRMARSINTNTSHMASRVSCASLRSWLTSHSSSVMAMKGGLCASALLVCVQIVELLVAGLRLVMKAAYGAVWTAAAA